MRYLNQKRRGTVAVLAAISMIAVIGFVAVAVDGGMLMHNRRQVQSIADAAALSAAEDLYYNYQANLGVDVGNSAKNAALQVAADNGYNNDGSTNLVTVNIPPTSGIAAGQAGYAEVIITYNQPRGFSSLFGSGTTPVRARAVAIGQWTAARVGIMVLDPTGSGALSVNGGGTMTVAGVPTIVDSNSPTAMTAVGGGTAVSPEFDVTGNPGYSGSGSWSGTIYSGVMQTPDPLRYLPEPDPSTMVVQSKNASHYSGNTAKTFSIQPGVYKGGITVSGQATLNMAPGIYYMDGGGFSFTGQGGLNATGVLIFSEPKSNSDTISINGNGSINFSPPTTGIYAGISLWQERSSTNTVYVSGNGTSSMSGTFYAQHGTLNVTGNGTGDVIGSQYISYDMVMGGNGGFTVNWNAAQAGRTRLIYLVE